MKKRTKIDEISFKECSFFLKKSLVFLSFLLFFGSFSSKNKDFNSILSDFYQKKNYLENGLKIKSGEKLKYKISYGEKNRRRGVLFAAYANLSFTEINKNNEIVYSISASGKTNRVFSLFMKVSHFYQSILNAENLNTLEHEMKVQEGKFLDEEKVCFKSDTLLKNIEINDILGTAYKLRAISNDSLKINDTIFFSYYYKNNIYDSYIVNLGKETIKTKFGPVKTIKFEPKLEKGRRFKKETGAVVWVTDDNMHLPVKIELPVLVGSVYASLVSYENIAIDLKN
jgi:hypothetical protein